jgi:hypothetical protein
MSRDLLKEIEELNILGIEGPDGILTESLIADVIDIHRQTVSELDWDRISQEIDEAMKAFAESV